MSSKTAIYLAAFVGSIIGGYIPTLWGAGLISFSSVLFSGLGGIAGVVIAWKFLG